MKLAISIGLAILLVLIGIRIADFLGQSRSLGKTLSDTEARLQKAQSDEANLSAQIQYLGDSANLEKELRAQFNYKKPGETMVIIVPATTSTPTGTSQ